MSSTTTQGLKLALLTALISGISIFVNKFAVGSITPPVLFTAVKNTAVALIVLSLLFSGGSLKKIRKLTKKEIKYLLLIGIIGGGIPFYLFFTGLSMTPAINAALIHKTLVIWVALFAVPFLKEKLSRTQAVAILLIFAGNLFIGGFKGFEFSGGELMILAATIFWAVENIFAKKVLKTVDSDLVVFARMGIGALFLLTVSAIQTPGGLVQVLHLTPTQYFWLTATSLTLFGYVATWYRALKLAPATSVAAVLVLSTLVTNVLAAVFTTGAWTVTMLFQLILMGMGTALLFRLEKKTSTASAS